jgi:hypothetical protein
MAGPTIQLRATNYAKVEQVKIKTLLNRIATVNVETDTQIEFCLKKGKTLGLNLKENSCTFIIQISHKVEYDALEKESIKRYLNDKPTAFITICSMCNQREDHFLLVALALEINKIVGGYINLNGAIISPLLKDNKGNFIHHTKQDEQNYVNAIEGAIYEISYIISESRNYYYHVVDRTWLKNWMEHIDFHLIK